MQNYNCYNYATDTKNAEMLQPGNGNQEDFPIKHYSCLAYFDGLQDVINGTDKLPKVTKGHLVALVVRPDGRDYHWYRQDSSLMFSHKVGRLAATDKDNDGRKIEDPRTCNRGSYTQFVGFMIVEKEKLKI